MSGLGDFLKEGMEIHIFSKKGLTSPFYFKVQEREIGKLSFDAHMEQGEFKSQSALLTISKNRFEEKIILRKGESDLAFCYEQPGMKGSMIMTDDSNIFFLKKSSIWNSSVSLIEHETGCWFFRFFPEANTDVASMKVEVCPIILDSETSLGLLVLSVFKLIDEEVSSRSE